MPPVKLFRPPSAQMIPSLVGVLIEVFKITAKKKSAASQTAAVGPG